MIRLTLTDLLSFLHCPMGAMAGYRAPYPHGDHETAVTIASEWPRSAHLLSKVVSDTRAATTFMSQSRFGVSQSLGAAAPPIARPDRGFWNGLRGEIHVPSADGDGMIVAFEPAALHRTSGLWEAIILDTHRTPPDEARWTDLAIEAQYLTHCLTYLTGEPAGVRLVAPAYEREEIVDVLPGRIELTATLWSVARAIPITRPGRHCNHTKVGRTQRSRVWACPLRENADCTPFGEVPPATIASDHHPHQ